MAKVVLQMGHCFRRTGATGTNGVDGDPNEQEFAQACCYAAASHLRAAGHSPLIIDADEPDAAYRGDAFVAVHCDGSTSPDARGASVGYRTSEGAHLGAQFKAAYAARGWVGWRPDNYTAALGGYYGTGAAVRVGNRHAVIVEAGFLTSPHDEPLLSLPDGPERAARAITDAIVAVFGGHTPDPEPEDDDMRSDRDMIELTKTALREAIKDPADPFRQEINGLIHWQLATQAAADAAPNLIKGDGSTLTSGEAAGYIHEATYKTAQKAGVPGYDLGAPPAEDTPAADV